MYMRVCKLHAGLTLISLPFKGDAGDLKKKKKRGGKAESESKQ